MSTTSGDALMGWIAGGLGVGSLVVCGVRPVLLGDRVDASRVEAAPRFAATRGASASVWSRHDRGF